LITEDYKIIFYIFYVPGFFCDAAVAEWTVMKQYFTLPSLRDELADHAHKIYDNIICWNKQYGNIPAGTVGRHTLPIFSSLD
jgi:hypothetical protein